MKIKNEEECKRREREMERCDEEASPSLIFGDAYEEGKGMNEIAVRATLEKS